MKILGLDVGQRRIGVAKASDGTVASFGIVESANLSEAIQKIGQICRQEQIEKIVVGLPRYRHTLQADKIHKFALELAKNLAMAVEFVDETLTSKEAERLLAESGLNPKSKKFKEEVDKLSAKMILEQYLNQ
jgi:putative Holliday junction resolvase